MTDSTISEHGLPDRRAPELGMSDSPVTDLAHKPREQPPLPPGGGAGANLTAMERLADRLDRAVPLADDAGNRVLVDNARTVRWAGPLFAVGSVILLPWIALTAAMLPSREISRNYDLAWAGFDVMLFGALAATGVLAMRRSRFLTVTASMSSAFLLADAWFDVMTSPAGRPMAMAGIESVFVELPLAALSLWIALHSQQVGEQRLLLLLRRDRRRVGSREAP